MQKYPLSAMKNIGIGTDFFSGHYILWNSYSPVVR